MSPGSGLLQDYLLSLPVSSSPDGTNDRLLIYDAADDELKQIAPDDLPGGGGSGIPNDGWIAAGDTWTYASAAGNVGTFTITGVDRTGVLQSGMRVKLTQTGAKYFIITKVAFSTNTTVTIYGGTDYTLANAAITSPSYSPVKVPFGFNCDPAKWTEAFTDTSTRAQSTPTSGTWYNVGPGGANTEKLDVPIGTWLLEYFCNFRFDINAATLMDGEVTLSTANNSESDPTMSDYRLEQGASGNLSREARVHGHRLVTLTSPATYYLNMATFTSSMAAIAIKGGDSTTIIRAVCALL